MNRFGLLMKKLLLGIAAACLAGFTFAQDAPLWMRHSVISPDGTHYDNIKRMVKEKTGRAMQEKERERKGKNGKIINR